jgi:hypothetical protein
MEQSTKMTAHDQKSDADLPEFGPAMLALPNDRQRAFVTALFDDDAPRKGDGLLIYAARTAGYGTPTSSRKSLNVIASRIAHDDRVQEAIAQFSHRVLRTIPPEAFKAAKNLIRDPKHKDHARAVFEILGRTDPLQTLHTVKVEDNRPPTIDATQAVLDRIEALMQRAGPLQPPPKIIDAKCSDVTEQAPA